MKLIVSYNIHGLSIASKRLQDDRELVQIAVDHFPTALQYASERLRDDRELVLRACSNMHFTFFDSIVSAVAGSISQGLAASACDFNREATS
ncbi:MAG: DUF4116 domain-containing protein [Bacteroidota bacterium]